MNDEKKIMMLLNIFLMQREVAQTAKENFKTDDNLITKLFITSDLMQFFLDNISSHPQITAISLFKPISGISCRVGDEGSLNGINFEIIKGKEKIYQGVEIYHSKLNE